MNMKGITGSGIKVGIIDTGPSNVLTCLHAYRLLLSLHDDS